ncbi:MAG: hypothetical protein ACYSUY_16515 [Planctomycetota bacterium]|jgi:hypothetical protein
MFPIFEQGKGKGIGHSSRSFIDRFAGICQEHLRSGRARAFAFIFYDFLDQDFKRILKNHGVFVQLDRLSGTDLSVFYLHSGGRKAVDRFNAEFISRIGVEGDIRLPCIVFFRLKEERIEDVAIVQLESSDLVHGFHELYEVIKQYLREELIDPPAVSKYLRWLKSSAKFIGLESFRAFLKAALEGIM